MDLVRIMTDERRSKVPFTVLKRKAPWTTGETGALVNELFTELYQIGAHPDVVIINGEYSQEKIAEIIGNNFDEHEIVVGYDNPKLPFKPPSF